MFNGAKVYKFLLYDDKGNDGRFARKRGSRGCIKSSRAFKRAPSFPQKRTVISTRRKKSFCLQEIIYIFAGLIK